MKRQRLLELAGLPLVEVSAANSGTSIIIIRDEEGYENHIGPFRSEQEAATFLQRAQQVAGEYDLGGEPSVEVLTSPEVFMSDLQQSQGT